MSLAFPVSFRACKVHWTLKHECLGLTKRNTDDISYAIPVAYRTGHVIIKIEGVSPWEYKITHWIMAHLLCASLYFHVDVSGKETVLSLLLGFIPWWTGTSKFHWKLALIIQQEMVIWPQCQRSGGSWRCESSSGNQELASCWNSSGRELKD